MVCVRSRVLPHGYAMLPNCRQVTQPVATGVCLELVPACAPAVLQGLSPSITVSYELKAARTVTVLSPGLLSAGLLWALLLCIFGLPMYVRLHGLVHLSKLL